MWPWLLLDAILPLLLSSPGSGSPEFRRLFDEPDVHLHLTGFAEGDVACVLTRDPMEGPVAVEVSPS